MNNKKYPIELESFDGYAESTSNRKPPSSSKYHYTTYAGLRGVIENGSLWFTDSQFLNDPEEQLYYLHRVKKLLETIINQADLSNEASDRESETMQNLFRVADEFLQRPHYGALGTNEIEDAIGKQRFRYYYFCLSNNRDDVALWSMYCEKHGYNLALSPYRIAKEIASIDAFQGTKLYFGSVEYDVDRQDELLKHCIDSIVREFDKHTDMFKESDQRLLVLRILFFRHFELCRLFIKNPFHSSEKEYRLVLKACRDDRSIKNGFRDRGGIVTPYKEIETTLSPLREICVGPALEFDLAKKGVESLLWEFGEASLSIVNSEGRVR